MIVVEKVNDEEKKMDWIRKWCRVTKSDDEPEIELNQLELPFRYSSFRIKPNGSKKVVALCEEWIDELRFNYSKHVYETKQCAVPLQDILPRQHSLPAEISHISVGLTDHFGRVFKFSLSLDESMSQHYFPCSPQIFHLMCQQPMTTVDQVQKEVLKRAVSVHLVSPDESETSEKNMTSQLAPYAWNLFFYQDGEYQPQNYTWLQGLVTNHQETVLQVVLEDGSVGLIPLVDPSLIQAM